MNGNFELVGRLATAVRENDLDAVHELLSQGADPNWPDIFSGYTPLHFAAVRGNLAMVKALVEAGADVNHSDNQRGETPLTQATEAGRTAVVNYLKSLSVGKHDD